MFVKLWNWALFLVRRIVCCQKGSRFWFLIVLKVVFSSFSIGDDYPFRRLLQAMEKKGCNFSREQPKIRNKSVSLHLVNHKLCNTSGKSFRFLWPSRGPLRRCLARLEAGAWALLCSMCGAWCYLCSSRASSVRGWRATFCPCMRAWNRGCGCWPRV